MDLLKSSKPINQEVLAEDLHTFINDALRFIETFTGDTTRTLIKKGSFEHTDFQIERSNNAQRRARIRIESTPETGYVVKCTVTVNSCIRVQVKENEEIELMSTGDLLDYLILHIHPELMHIRSALYVTTIINMLQKNTFKVNVNSEANNLSLIIENTKTQKKVELKYSSSKRVITMTIPARGKEILLQPILNQKLVELDEETALVDEGYMNPRNKKLIKHPCTANSVNLIMRALGSPSIFNTSPQSTESKATKFGSLGG